MDRHLGAHLFDPATGGVMLWQHLFWFFGHPEVYILALPFFGIVSEIFPSSAASRFFGYTGLVYATLGIAALSIAVWAHHMYATGAVLLPYFSFMTFLIAVPTGVKFFNWIGTMWKGQLTFESPMLFSVGFLVTFLFGGLSGVILASRLGLSCHRLVLCCRAFPLRPLRDNRVRDIRRNLLLVPENDRPDVGREARQDPFLVDPDRFHATFSRPALARRPGHASAVRGLPAVGQFHSSQHDLDHRRVCARSLDDSVRLERFPRATGTAEL